MATVILSKGPPVQVEVARTPAARAQGLMYRAHLPANSGMLFAFPKEEQRTFHMRHTWIPLDILFFDRKGLLVGFVADVKPESPRPVGVPSPSSYVLEVNAGWVKRHGIRVGDRLQFVEEK